MRRGSSDNVTASAGVDFYAYESWFFHYQQHVLSNNNTNLYNVIGSGYDENGQVYIVFYASAEDDGEPASLAICGTLRGGMDQNGPVYKEIIPQLESYGDPELTKLAASLTKIPNDASRDHENLGFLCDSNCLNVITTLLEL